MQRFFLFWGTINHFRIFPKSNLYKFEKNLTKNK